ncbi:MAG: aminopeptidase P N-terminal domain-containing protein, partial [Gemmatimonadota bacterium]
FRQLDDFLYLTGLELPGSVLALDAQGGSMLFVPRRDFRFEDPDRPNDFPGLALADDPEIARVSAVAVAPIEALDSRLDVWRRAGRPIRYDPGRPGTIREVETSLIPDWDPLLLGLYHLQQMHPDLRILNAHEDVAAARMVKSEAEIAVMRRAAELSGRAIRIAARQVRHGATERELEASLEAACKRGGAQTTAFDPIVKSGPNSLWPWRILAAHHDRRNRAMRNGELVILDVGCELDRYASDVGRTFPVSGRFTDEQRRLLEMQIGVADAIIAAVRPGVTFAELQVVADSAIPPEHRPHMQTGGFFGHHIGLSAADPSLPDAPLAPGMVFTVEPWYYDHERGIAVCTEDEVLVTEDGAELLTAGLPRAPGALEALVTARSP